MVAGLFTGSTDITLVELAGDAKERGILFQRCLANLINYQPPTLYSSLASNCPALTLIDSPFHSEEITFLASAAGSEFANVLFEGSAPDAARRWLKGHRSLKPSVRALLQSLVYLRLYLSSTEKVVGGVEKDLTGSQETAWNQRNLRYPILIRPHPDFKDFHLLTLHLNLAVENARLRHARLVASSPGRDARALGKLLATSLYTCIEFNCDSLLQVVRWLEGNLKFLAEFGSVMPLAWYSPKFMEALFSRGSEELKGAEARSGEIVADTLKVWSYWARRAGPPQVPAASNLARPTFQKIQVLVDDTIKKLQVPTTRGAFSKADVRSIIQSSMILLSKTPSQYDLKDARIKVLADILNSDLITDICEAGETEDPSEMRTGDVIQAAIATILQDYASDPRPLMEAYFSNASSLSQCLDSAPENALLEQGMKVFSLSQFHISQLLKSDGLRLSDPYAWAPVTTLPHQLFLGDAASSRLSSLFALGGSYLGLKAIPSRKKPSFWKEVEECFLSSVGYQLSKFKADTALQDPVWEGYAALSESPLFRETGRISKLLGRILMSHLAFEGIQAFSGVRALAGLLSSGPHSSRTAAQDKFQMSLDALRELSSFLESFHSLWARHYDSRVRDLSDASSDGLRKCLRSVLFACTLILQATIMRPSTVAEPSDVELELALVSLLNIHFALIIQSPRVMFNGHNDSKELFYFWFLEHAMPQLTGEQVESFLPQIRIYLIKRQPWSQDLFEAAHSIVLAMFRSINHPILGNFAPWYQQLLLLQYPIWLTTDQFRFAYTLMVEGVARQEAMGDHTVWALIRHLADLISTQGEKLAPTTVPGYFQTFVRLLPSVPITYLPTFTRRVEKLALSLSSPSSGGLALEAAAKLVFDVVSQQTLSTTHKAFAVPWYLRFLKLAAPATNPQSTLDASR
ncbi:hypothetical protein L0F63_006239 [Massospora cicadina]|nr:hypothetical protein L0F63_006239 [Massospora cicadina]